MMFKRSITTMSKVLTKNTLSPNILKTQYAVRGEVAIRANKYAAQLQQGGSKSGLPFDEILYCNIGNPQQLQQKPITFFRNVLALATSPTLMEHAKELSTVFKPDVIRRAQQLINDALDKGSSTGAYTHSQGLPYVRKHVAQFIQARDGLAEAVNPDSIFLTDGASPAVQMMLRALIVNEKSGIMIPVPQYPLYSASIQLFGGSQVGYFLNESKGWSLDRESLESAYEEAISKGIDVRALCVINPGNPTGQILDRKNMEDIVDFCERRRVLLLADEVYQTNNYHETKKWYSFSRIAHEMGKSKTLEMVSFHSVSKGFLGECGRRGGYMHLSDAIDPEVREQLYKLSSINLCPNVDGQIMVDLMVNPPKAGDESYEQYTAERDTILASLKKRAKMIAQALNKLEGVSCNDCEGAMYAFPQITLPARAVEEATKRGIAPDMLYVLELLDETGICVVPGSGFLQYPGTYHFRTTFLCPEHQTAAFCEKIAAFHAKFMAKYK